MSEEISKITTQMRKWILEYMILSIIKNGEAYSSDIISHLKEAKMIVVEWTLYPLLSRLKTDWLITYTWLESKSWPPRKYYKLTSEWLEIHKIMNEVWNEISFWVNKINNL